MSIWSYNTVSSASISTLRRRSCIYCSSPLTSLAGNEHFSRPDPYYQETRYQLVRVCPLCGWWTARIQKAVVRTGDGGYSHLGGMATLKHLNLADASVPIDEVRRFLLAKYQKRFEVHPRLFEETVAAVFRDCGYDVVVTGYTNDGGVDVILTASGREIGVQVKRYRSTIKVEQLRALVGALVQRGITSGIFVTTSDFQRGGKRVVEEFGKRGFTIQLLNAKTFYEALKLSQRPMYMDIEAFRAQHDLDDLPYYLEAGRNFFPQKDFVDLVQRLGGVHAVRNVVTREGID